MDASQYDLAAGCKADKYHMPDITGNTVCPGGKGVACYRVACSHFNTTSLDRSVPIWKQIIYHWK